MTGGVMHVLDAHAHAQCLMPVQDAEDGQVRMNPGSSCIINESSVVFAIAPSPEATQTIRRSSDGEWLRWVAVAAEQP